MRNRHRLAVVLVGSVSLGIAACGDDAADTTRRSDDASRTIEIDMVDIAFQPDVLKVERGETIRFVFTNRGGVTHDAFIGDGAAQPDHEAEMRDAEEGGHGGGHGDESEDAVTIEPGETADLTYTFDDAGTVEVGCHQPGHYDGGMRINVEIT